MDIQKNYAVERFNGENFHNWQYRLEMLLKAKRLWNIAKGNEVLSGSDANDQQKQKEHQEKLDETMALISMTIDDRHISIIQNVKTPKEALEKLATYYQNPGPSNKLFLRQKLTQCKLEENESIMEFINKIQKLKMQLEQIGSNVTDEEVLLTVFNGLPEKYRSVVTALQCFNNLTLDMVTSRLLHEELRLNQHQEHEDKALFSRSSKRNGRRNKPKTDHRRNPEVKCWNCGEKGHIKKDCKKGTYHRQANYVELFMASKEKQLKESVWILDSGATQHMCCKKELFQELNDIRPINVYLGDNSCINALGKGIVRFKMKDRNNKEVVTMLRDVLYVPSLTKNLFSIPKATEVGAKFEIEEDKVLVKNSKNHIVGKATKKGNLFVLDCEPERSQVNITDGKPDEAILWHKRLGHINFAKMKKLNDMVDGIPNLKIDTHYFCESCIKGKHKRKDISKKPSLRENEPLKLVHTDICGPMSVASLGGHRYFTTFIDDTTRYTHVAFLKNKSEVSTKFKEYATMIETQTGLKIKAIRSDYGGEYTGYPFQQFLKEKGILHKPVAPHTPEHNGVAERKNRTLVEMARTMIEDKNLPKSFWAEAISLSNYLLNRLPTKALEDKTPFEALFKERPNLENIKVFGSKAFMLNYNRRKLDAKTRNCIYLGPELNTKAHKLFDPVKKRVFMSRDVVFIEVEQTENGEKEKSKQDQLEIRVDLEKEKLTHPSQQQVQQQEQVDNQDEDENPIGIQRRDHENQDEASEGSEDDEETEEEVREEEREEGRREEQQQQQQISSSSNRNNEKYSRYGRKIKPVKRLINEYAHYTAVEPQTYDEAINSDESSKWREAMEREIDSLERNNTWKLVPKPKDRDIVGCKWVFKVKLKADGSIERYKARLVAKGFTQQQGIDYGETFAPVARATTIRCLLSIVAAEDLHLHQMDVDSAFLYGTLEETIFMEQPIGFINEKHLNHVCRLNKSLYGLKQSPRIWNELLTQHLEQQGFKNSKSEPCLFSKINESTKIIVVIYVDDLLIASNSLKEIDKFKDAMQSSFNMKDLGEAKYCLGIEIVWNKEQGILTILQRKYLEETLEQFEMKESKSVSTPIVNNVSSKSESDELSTQVPYREAVGKLLYAATRTRPDIAYATNYVSRFMCDPKVQHWKIIKRILRYIKGTTDLKITYRRNSKQKQVLMGYCDADWANDQGDRKSTSGFVFMLNGGAISWQSCKQRTVALSTAEAEYISLAEAVKEAVWLRKLLKDFGVTQKEPTCIYEDNQSCIAITQNPVFHPRTKHIDIKYHFTREMIKRSEVQIIYCPTEMMIADCLTKPCGKNKFEYCRTQMGISNI
jgi:hypothetical protein